MLDRLIAKGSGQPDARVMLNAYVGMLRRKHLTDPRLEDLARGLWREHREVLEFLMSRKPDVGYEVFSQMLDDLTAVATIFSAATGMEIVPDQSTKTYLRFGIKEWDSVPGMLTGTGWKPSNRMLLFEIWRTSTGTIRCKVELGPGEQDKRERLFQAFKEAGADVGGNWPLAAKWRQLSAKQLANPTEDDDPADIRAQVTSGAAHFLRTHLPKYNAAAKKLVVNKD
jgi:hypothetical protein